MSVSACLYACEHIFNENKSSGIVLTKKCMWGIRIVLSVIPNYSYFL